MDESMYPGWINKMGAGMDESMYPGWRNKMG